MTDKKLQSLVINKLTAEQYATSSKSQDELWLVTDDNTYATTQELATKQDIMQYTTMPTASASNVSKVIQYVGATDANYTNGYFYVNVPTYVPQSASISQTTGTSGLTYLSVDVDTFVAEEQPSGNETVDFTASVEAATVSFVPQSTWSIVATAGQIKQMFLYEGNIDIDSLTPAEQQNLFVEYYNSNNVGFGWSGTTFINISVAYLNDYGITFTGTPVDGESTTGSYTPMTTTWSKSGTVVDLSNYGISYAGQPDHGDVLTVVYTAAYISGYNWNQINVQPGGGTTIDWTGHWDMPANTSYGYLYPRFDFDVLPDGEYEFYYQYLTINSSYIKIWTPTTILLQFTKSSGAVNGSVNVVLDGQTSMLSSNNNFGTQSWINLIHNVELNKDSIISGNVGWWATQASDGNVDYSVPNVYRWTDVKNVTTGQTYPVSAVVSVDSAPYPSDFSYYSGDIRSGEFVYIPNPHYLITAETEMNSNCYGFILYGVGGEFTGSVNSMFNTKVTVSATDRTGLNRFEADLYFNAWGQHYTVKTATGFFEGARIGFRQKWDATVYLLFNNMYTGNNIGMNYTMSVFGSKDSVSGMNFLYEQPTTFIEFDNLTVGGNITVNTLGTVLQYTGETNASYTKGYFYEATGTIVTVPSTVDCTSNDPNFTVTMTDVDGFVRYMSTTFGYDQEWIESQLNSSYFTYQEDTNSMVWGPYGTFSSADSTIVLGFFNITPALGQGGYLYWDTSNFVKGSQSVQSQSWQQTDVQPAGSQTTYQPFSAGWDISHTTKDFCDDVNADASAVEGMAYLGEVVFTDMPNNLGNAECVVEIMMQNPSNKIITLTLTSGNISPYMWKYTYWNNGTNVSGWQTWQEPLVSGTNIKTINEGSLLGSGNISLVPQWSSMPQASTAYYGNIVQFKGTTDVNYTNGYFYKCSLVSTNPDAYGWVQVDVQPQVSPLPSQSGQSGKFLTTDGTDASWGDALVNAATGTNSLAILGGCINNNGVALGKSAYAVTGGIGVGYTAESTWDYGIAVGYQAKAYAIGAIQLGKGTNSTAGTMSIGLTTNGTSWTNYTLLNSDGTVPTDRFTTTPSADGTYVPTLTIASGVATRTWGAAPSGGSVPTLTWYTVSTAGSTLTIADTSSAQLVKIYKNGLLLQPTDDYTISGTTLTMVTALVVGDKITTEVF